jgi:hypothetical protein
MGRAFLSGRNRKAADTKRSMRSNRKQALFSAGFYAFAGFYLSAGFVACRGVPKATPWLTV